MLQKLELDALRADLSSVESMLAARTAVTDPIGHLQLTERKSEIEGLIGNLSITSIHHGAIAIFFGGLPVVGSKGIMANFAGKALDAFHDVVSKQFAIEELGSLGARGPVPFINDKRLMVTDVARGSFGFVLEEADQNGSLTDTEIKTALASAASLVIATASPSEEEFERAVDTLDPRLLQSLKKFFAVLEEGQSTIRLVEGAHESQLDRQAVARAKVRTERLNIEERETDQVVGVLLGLLPQHKRFEMKLLESGEVISGSVSPDISKRALESAISATNQLIGKTWRTKMKVREVTERNRSPRNAYTLVALVEEAKPK